MKKYNSYIYLNIFLLFIVFFYSCKNDTKEEPDTLNVYNWAFVIPEQVIEGFEQKYNVKVTYDNYLSNEELLAKIRNPNHGYDVIFPSDYMIEIMVKQNMLRELNYDNIPNATNIDSEFKSLFFDPDNKYSVPFEWSTTGLGVNTNKIKNIPDSWDVLFDDAYKGKITMLDDMRFGIVPPLLLNGFDVNTTNPEELKVATEILRKQKSNVKAYSSSTYIDLLKSEDVWLSYGYSIDLLKIESEMPHIKYIIPKEGTVEAVESMCIPKESKRVKLAELFINYILDEKVHASCTNYSFAANPNHAAKKHIKEDIKNNKNVYPDSLQLEKMYFLKDVGSATQLYDDAWNKIKN